MCSVRLHRCTVEERPRAAPPHPRGSGGESSGEAGRPGRSLLSIALAGITCLALALRLAGLGAPSLWHDEALELARAAGGWSILLFGLTTDPRAFVLDLERRRLSPRFAFVAMATLEAVPAMVERATVIQSSQRSRGLDTEGSVWARVRGVLPLVVPVILSSLTEVEERSLALEVRAFGRPGRRHLLWHVPDSTAQLIARSVLVLLLVALIVGRVTGLLPATP